MMLHNSSDIIIAIIIIIIIAIIIIIIIVIIIVIIIIYSFKACLFSLAILSLFNSRLALTEKPKRGLFFSC